MRWFRSKPKTKASFRSVAPSGLVDLHSHVLPGVDDGASDLAEATAMLDAMGDLGFVKMAATPHFDTPEGQPDAASQRAHIAALSSARDCRPPSVAVGAEIVFDELFLRREKEGAVPGIAERQIYLVELGFLPGMVSPGLSDRMFRFQAEEKQLILAHPERIPDFQEVPEKAGTLHRTGVLMQMDVMSLVGRYGRRAERTARRMLELGLYDVAASDLHHLHDVDMLRSALEALVDWDEREFERLFSVNAACVIEGRVEEVVSNA